MKQYQIKCDVCGREIDDLETVNRIILQNLSDKVTYEFSYVCPYCFAKTYKCVKELAKENNNGN